MKSYLQKAGKFLYLSALMSLFFPSNISAQTLKGKITDANTKEDLIGATITIVSQAKKFNSVTGLDGSFYVKNIPAGTYNLSVSHIGYEVHKKEIEVKGTNPSENVHSINLNASIVNLDEVSVGAKANKESDEYARRSELKAGNILNIVSAKTMEISPDITVGNVLQRVSGVSMVRSGSGDGQYVIIRGLPNRYTYTSLNGVILPSPDAQTRSIPMDMFPANMIERVEIIKSLTPNLEGNAIGGAANMVMKDSPNHLTINGTISVGGNTIFSDQAFSGFSTKGLNFKSPSEINGNSYQAKISDFSVNHLTFKKESLPLNLVANFSVGDKVLNRKLGYLIGASYIREYRGSNSLLYIGQSIITNPYAANAAPTVNNSEYTAIQNREYSSLQSRLGLQGKLDYTFSQNHIVKLYGLFLQMDDNQHRAMVQNGLSNGGEIDYFDRVAFTRKNIANVSLNGVHNLTKNLTVDWTASYAISSSDRPDWTDFGRFKQKASDETVFVSNPLTHQWLRSNDKDKSGYLNIKYTPNKKIEISAGGMYRSKERFAFYNIYKENTVVPGLGVQQFTDINKIIFSFSPAQNAFADSTNGNNYNGTEKVGALYLMAKINAFNNKLEILGGVRQETTTQNYYSNISKALPDKDGQHTYTDVLPSLNFKYKLTDKQNLRLSYFSGISRPNLYELIPASISGDLYTESGNPLLKHTTSQNLDIRYEHFFTSTNYIVAGSFYKNLVNPIEVAFGAPGSATASTLQPLNPDKPAKVYGFEFLFSKFIRSFGISGNYTYIHSEVTTSKLIQQNDKTGSTVGVLVDQIRPMQGQANHIANLSLLYKNPESGLNLQLSYIFTGDRISIISPYYGLDQWQRANSQLDFSLNKTFKNKITFFVKATNLLNTNIYQDILTPNVRASNGYPDNADANRILVQKDVFKQSILAGIRLSL
jgi:TonB dependent receptor/CarboxypepD_reg-like domain/TonB-dependent Receptor Plug Domain